jgi:hypothetical protein
VRENAILHIAQKFGELGVGYETARRSREHVDSATGLSRSPAHRRHAGSVTTQWIALPHYRIRQSCSPTWRERVHGRAAIEQAAQTLRDTSFVDVYKSMPARQANLATQKHKQKSYVQRYSCGC